MKEAIELMNSRNEKIYAEFMSGKQYKQLAYRYELSIESIKRVLMEYRKKYNLPNGRKYAQRKN